MEKISCTQKMNTKNPREINDGIVKFWEKTWYYNARVNSETVRKLYMNSGKLNDLASCKIGDKKATSYHVIGSGASLDDTVGDLKALVLSNPKKHKIVAGTSNADVMFAKGLTPSFIVALDAQAEVAEHIRRFIKSVDCMKTKFVLNPTIHNKVFKLLEEYGHTPVMANYKVQASDLSYSLPFNTALSAMYPEIVATMPACGSTMGQQLAVILFLLLTRKVPVRKVYLWGCDLSYVNDKQHCVNYKLNEGNKIVFRIDHGLIDAVADKNIIEVGPHKCSIIMTSYAKSCMVLLKALQKEDVLIQNRSIGLLDQEDN